MPLKSAKPATEMVSGLRKSEQLGGELRFQANPQRLSIQAVDISGPLEFALNGREVIRAEISVFNGRQSLKLGDGIKPRTVAYGQRRRVSPALFVTCRQKQHC
jgi:hypothetical protein